jgi:hypothetical protein
MKAKKFPQDGIVLEVIENLHEVILKNKSGH